jgi:hypothetical protein
MQGAGRGASGGGERVRGGSHAEDAEDAEDTARWAGRLRGSPLLQRGVGGDSRSGLGPVGEGGSAQLRSHAEGAEDAEENGEPQRNHIRLTNQSAKADFL